MFLAPPFPLHPSALMRCRQVFGVFHPAWSHPAPSAPCRPQAGVPSCSPKSVSTHSRGQGRKAGGVTGPGHALAAQKNKNKKIPVLVQGCCVPRQSFLRAATISSRISPNFSISASSFLPPGSPADPEKGKKTEFWGRWQSLWTFPTRGCHGDADGTGALRACLLPSSLQGFRFAS